MSYTENEYGILKCAYNVHSELGPGLLESAYEECLFYELVNSGYQVQKQIGIPLRYKEVELLCAYRLDLLIEERIIFEIKSVETLNDVHLAQLITYLKLMDLKLGFLINFNVTSLKHGIRRVVNNY